MSLFVDDCVTQEVVGEFVHGLVPTHLERWRTWVEDRIEPLAAGWRWALARSSTAPLFWRPSPDGLERHREFVEVLPIPSRCLRLSSL